MSVLKGFIMTKINEKVLILGASDNPRRYSHRAFAMLRTHGHMPVPVHPHLHDIEGIPCYATIDDAARSAGPIDTLTIYVNSSVSSALAESILKLRPRRIIFNPGAENPALQSLAQQKGIECIEGCTLVMLSTGQF
jgi:predicted CoA-binding protein